MKTKHTVIAACIATLFFSGAVFAKDSWNYHENEWNSVKSYGKVAIAQDSVEQWGPWEDFAEPAAGLIAPATLLGFAPNEAYRNNPNVTPTPQGNICAAGDWCGYAIFRNSNYSEEERSASLQCSPPPLNTGLFSLTLVPDDSGITAGSGRGEGTVFWRLTAIDPAVSPTLTDSGTNIPVYFGGRIDDGLHHFSAYFDRALAFTGSYDEASASGFSHFVFSTEAQREVGKGPFEMAVSAFYYNPDADWKHKWSQNDEVAVGVFRRSVESYVNGDGEYGYWTSKSIDGYYVAGIATPQAYLADQQTRNIKATYMGGWFDGIESWKTPGKQGLVRIDVSFGDSKWKGTWYPADFKTFGFTANGVVNGANIVSTGFEQQKNATLSGYVQGTFYGQTAGSIGGVSSVTKTPVNVDTRSIAPQTPVTQTAIFLVNKVPTPPVVTPR